MCDDHPTTIDAPAASRSIARRTLLAGGLAAGVLPFLPGLSLPAAADFGFLPPRPASEKYVRPMMYPVLPDPTLGSATWTDTYLAPRSNGRKHEGQDLIGKKMLKLLACVDGTIVELVYGSGGNALYLQGDDGWFYCYLHINNDDPGTDNGANQFQYAFTPGMAVGKRVLQGQHIAYLGDSGNAEDTVSHCHFEIRMPNDHWYNAAAVQASYSLQAATPAHLRPVVPASAFAPFAGASPFTVQQANDFLGGAPSWPWVTSSVERLEGGTVTPAAFIAGILDEPRWRDVSAWVMRLYLSIHLRMPDYGGYDYWVTKIRGGVPLASVATYFCNSNEFQARYGSLDNTAFLSLVYRNVFQREIDPSGADYYGRKLAAGTSRGAVMLELCGSQEFQARTRSTVRVSGVYTGMVRRMPDQGGFDYWTQVDATNPRGLESLADSFLRSNEYRARF
jgi:murein DD-endopeptidase MepM/ murein hydrolase activator NlpD